MGNQDWITFDSESLQLVFTPQNENAGEYELKITATDNHGASDVKIIPVIIESTNRTQEIVTQPGWNWISFNVGDNMSVNELGLLNLSGNNIPTLTLKDQLKSTDYYPYS